MVVHPQLLRCRVLWDLTLGLRQDWTCNCTVTMSVKRIKMSCNFKSC